MPAGGSGGGCGGGGEYVGGRVYVASEQGGEGHIILRSTRHLEKHTASFTIYTDQCDILTFKTSQYTRAQDWYLVAREAACVDCSEQAVQSTPGSSVVPSVLMGQ